MHDSPSTRGFASMDAVRQKEIAKAGGKAAHQRGTAHEFTSDEASLAGKKGGLIISQDRSHMAEIGRLGGLTRGRRYRAQHAMAQSGASPSPAPKPDA
jgi:general stress protein YciG